MKSISRRTFRCIIRTKRSYMQRVMPRWTWACTVKDYGTWKKTGKGRSQPPTDLDRAELATGAAAVFLSFAASASVARNPRSGEVKPRKSSKSWSYHIMLLCSSHYISLHTASFCVHDISKCSPRDSLHFVPLCHARLSSSWCPNLWCKSAIWFLLLLLIRTWCFVIFVAFDVCILWAWALHVFCTMPCHLYRGAFHIFLWSMWWLAQACKVA